MKKSRKITLTAILIKDNDVGGYTSYIEEMPEVIAGGDTQNQAIDNLIEAFSIVMETKRELAEEENKGKENIIRKPLSLELA